MIIQIKTTPNGVVFIKSESYLFCFNDHLFLYLPYVILPIALLLLSLLLTLLLPPN